jgi:hypothetical protein
MKELNDDDKVFIKKVMVEAAMVTNVEIDDNPWDDMYPQCLDIMIAALRYKVDKLTMFAGVEFLNAAGEDVLQPDPDEFLDIARAGELLEALVELRKGAEE